MDKKNYFILFVVGILVFSCSSPQKTEPLFEQQKELTFNTLNVDELFFKPLCIEVFDSLLLVCDPTDEGIYTVLNLETKSLSLIHISLMKNTLLAGKKAIYK